jgi:hypothetical protein
MSRSDDVALLTAAVESVDADTAPAEALQRLGADTLRDVQPPPFLAALWVLWRVSRHEAAHAWYGYRAGWNIRRLSLRQDATGLCQIAGNNDDYATALDLIVFQLVGLAHDLREDDATVLHCYDTVSARLKIDALNARGIGPPVAFRHVAELAVGFVDEHIAAIHNIGLVLYHSRELIHDDVALFGRCRS